MLYEVITRAQANLRGAALLLWKRAERLGVSMVFARKVWKLLVALKDGLALLFLLLFFAALYGVLSIRPGPGQVKKGALLIDLSGVIVESYNFV